MDFTGERLIPEKNQNDLILGEHLARYYFARSFVKGKKVLDVACGTGYGTKILAEAGAIETFGVDISTEAIDYARENYSSENAKFSLGNAEKLDFPDKEFDVIVSFETIEHLNDYCKFLKEIKRVLKEDGTFIVSTPNKALYPEGNPFHVKEFYRDEFISELRQFFENVKLKEQQTFVDNAIFDEKENYQGNGETFNNTKKVEGLYLIAICSKSIPTLSKTFSLLTSANDIVSPSLIKELEERTSWAKSLEKDMEERTAWAKSLEKELKERTTWAKSLEKDLEEKTAWAKNLEKEINDKTISIEKLEKGLSDEKALVRKLKNQLKEMSDNFKKLDEKEKQEIDNLSHSLKVDEERVRAITNSFSYRLGRFLTFPIRAFFPLRSRREVLLHVFIKALCSPKKFFHSFSFHNVKRFFKALWKENSSTVMTNVKSYISREGDFKKTDPSALEIFDGLNTNEKLIFKKEFKPKVSIIIPVYNNWSYNYRCLFSILKNTKDISYEVIIADDASTDQTKEIDKYIENIIVARTPGNLGFLRNCNNAVKYTHGEYLFLLNNDTTVQKGWLKPLIDLIESDEKIGMVGSKLVYPDGRLQEAGGIIWNNASGWNYGKFDDPNKPEYNYVKEVDYISGAAIMTSKKLWNEIGGFDERYDFAYFEDVDFAFEVRKKGYKVVYQPESVIAHFEGVSHGTNEESGLKTYQKKNKEIFLKKWEKVLKIGNFENAKDVFWARDRSGNKKTILVVDHYVPHYDKDAGSRTLYQYLQYFTKIGLNVKFIGDNFHKHEPYTSKLQQMGIEVLYGVFYRDNWKQWMKENAKYFDYIYLHRVHVAMKYIDFVKKNTSAKILYNAVDFSFLREERQYQVTGDPKYLKQAEENKKQEFYLFKQSDTVLTISEYEKELLKKEMPEKDVYVIPTFIYDIKKISNKAEYSDRKDITFVGGFCHDPNVDAVLWFTKEAFPKIVKIYPNIILNVIGSNPPKEILALKSKNINVTGFVSDEELERYYTKSRLIIAPLRFGAGVKGKIIEAIAHGVPVVSTKIGAEGIPESSGIIAIAKTLDQFTDKVIELYNTERKWDNIRQKSENYTAKFLSLQSAENVWGEIIGLPRR